MSDIRQINSCQHRFVKDKCLACGQYQYKNEALKTNKYSSPFHFNIRHYLRSLRMSASKVTDPHEISDDTFQLLTAICDKFLFTTQTLALGLYIYQTLHKLNACEKFWASAALIVAGKAVQLDKNVPYLNRYQRYAQKSFSQQQYEQAERTIFEIMNFEVQYSTFITFLDFYLTCGIIFKEDGLNNTLVEFFEDDVTTRAKDFLKKSIFTKYDPELLALGIIKEIRIKYNLKGWNRHLQELAGYSEDEIIPISSHESPLRQLSSNQARVGQVKGMGGVRKKYQNLIRQDKAALEKYTSISKPTVLKQNSYSSSKLLLLPSNPRKSSHTIIGQSIGAVLSSDLLSKRR